jgi:hypothetical protein
VLQRCGVVKLQRYLTKNEYMKEDNISEKEGGEYKFTSTAADGETETTHLSMQQLIEILHFEISIHAEYIDPNLKNVIPLDKWELELESSEFIASVRKLGVSTTESVIEFYKTHSSSVSKYIQRALDPAITDEMKKWLALRDALRDEVQRRKQTEIEKPKLKRAVLPSELPHYTFREARNPSIAIANADEWTEVIGETALMHAKDGEPIQTKLIAGSNLDWWDAPATCDNLRDELKTLGVRGVFFFNLTLAMVLQLQESHITVELNDLTKLFGWSSSTAAKNEERRRTLFRWLTLFDNISVHGNRGGSYKDKLTKQVLDTTIQDKLFMISGLERPDQSEQEIKTNGRLAPVRVTLTCGPWLERFRGDDKILHYFGNILKLSGLPTDQAHGEWALSIGMALSQLWRERAAHYTEVKREGDNKRETVAYDRPFTRFEIFKLFPPGRFRVNDILNSSDPARAIKYWDSAIKLLQETKNQTQENKKQISHYKELTGIPLPRQGWQDIWLNQHKFDIRPTGAARNEAVEISKSAKTKRRTWVKRKSKAAKTS